MKIAGNQWNNLSDLLAHQAETYADRDFLLFDQQPISRPPGHGKRADFRETLSFTAFNQRVNQACRLLESQGLGRGDVYNLHLPNSVAFMVLWFAGARLGAVMMPTNVQSSLAEMEYLLGHSGARIAFTTAQYTESIERCRDVLPALRRVVLCDPYSATPEDQSFEAQLTQFDPSPYPCPCAPTELAAIMYTSGTTSKPKGVMVTHTNYMVAGSTVANRLALTNMDRQFTVLPMFHGNAQYYSMMSALLKGASVALMDRFSASQYMEKCIEYQCTVASLFAAPMRMILSQPEVAAHRHNALRAVIYAQNITAQQQQEWHRRFGAPLSQLWGMTETMGPPLMNPIDGSQRNWTVGKPVGGYVVKLLDEKGQQTAPGDQGEIVVQGVPGETIMQGYFKNQEATRQTIQDGWLYTGDNAVIEQDGYYRFVDRIKDMIKRSGENVSAGEVESVLLEHPKVFECAVIGMPDEIRDEEIVAVVVPHDDETISETELIEFCKEKLATFRIPQRVVLRARLPKTSVGKIQKHILKSDIEKDLRP